MPITTTREETLARILVLIGKHRDVNTLRRSIGQECGPWHLGSNVKAYNIREEILCEALLRLSGPSTNGAERKRRGAVALPGQRGLPSVAPDVPLETDEAFGDEDELSVFD